MSVSTTMLDALAAWCNEKNIGNAEWTLRSAQYLRVQKVCNAHDDLVAALEEAIEHMVSAAMQGNITPSEIVAIRSARAALAKAGAV